MPYPLLPPKDNFSLVPNEILDIVLPRIKGEYFRVFFVILRQTIGWQDKKTKKKKLWDQLSLTQIEEKTMMSRMSVSRSIKGLIDDNLIIKRIEGDNGTEKCFYCINGEEIERLKNLYQCLKDTPPVTNCYPPSNKLLPPPVTNCYPQKKDIQNKVAKESIHKVKGCVSLPKPSEPEKTHPSLSKKEKEQQQEKTKFVTLSDKERTSLLKEFGSEILEMKICKMESHCAKKGITYPKCYEELRAWCLEESVKKKNSPIGKKIEKRRSLVESNKEFSRRLVKVNERLTRIGVIRMDNDCLSLNFTRKADGYLYSRDISYTELAFVQQVYSWVEKAEVPEFYTVQDIEEFIQ